MNVLEDPENGIVDGNHRSFDFNLLIIQYFSTVLFDCD